MTYPHIPVFFGFSKLYRMFALHAIKKGLSPLHLDPNIPFQFYVIKTHTFTSLRKCSNT